MKMHVSTSTYRVQLNKDFGFDQLESIIDYLEALGISTIYASPITTATPGSLHGYDVIDPHNINPEIGTIEQLRRIAAKLKEKGMTWIQDIVPNHMAFSPLNLRLKDILERGPSSEFFHYFDINWNHPDSELNGKLMVPILEAAKETCLNEGKINLRYDEHDGLVMECGSTRLPLSISAYTALSNNCGENQELNELLLKVREDCWKCS